jgi:excisionase family DNA binding protein
LAQARTGALPGDGFHHPKKRKSPREQQRAGGSWVIDPHKEKYLISHGNEQPRMAARCTFNGLGSPNLFFMEKMMTTSTPTQAINNSAAPLVFLTVEQVAKRLYVGCSTAYNMVNSGEIPSVLFGRLIRVPASALEQYLSNKLPLSLQANK